MLQLQYISKTKNFLINIQKKFLFMFFIIFLICSLYSQDNNKLSTCSDTKEINELKKKLEILKKNKEYYKNMCKKDKDSKIHIKNETIDFNKVFNFYIKKTKAECKEKEKNLNKIQNQ